MLTNETATSLEILMVNEIWQCFSPKMVCLVGKAIDQDTKMFEKKMFENS